VVFLSFQKNNGTIPKDHFHPQSFHFIIQNNPAIRRYVNCADDKDMDQFISIPKHDYRMCKLHETNKGYDYTSHFKSASAVRAEYQY
jgi:hypothetical protein